MNKTIIININGIVFHIEEDAYEMLRLYMTNVKQHFTYSADSEEIVTDIENRIAEIFTERLAEDKRQVIVNADVEFVITQMGQADEFEIDNDEHPLYPAEYGAPKKLYRDTEDRIIGGVCSGIGHYFNIEPRWVRIIALIIVLLGGSGLLIYGILWIIMPKAKTRSEKMAMKGEAINLQNLKRNFDEEFNDLQGNLKRNTGPVIRKAGNFFEEIFQHLGAFLSSVIKIFVKIIGVFIVLTGAVALIGFAGALTGLLGFWSSTETTFFPFSAINPEYETPLYFSAFVLIIIPIIALILFALRILLNRKVVTKTGSFAMLVIWLTGLIVAVYYGTKLGTEFASEATFSQVTELKPQPVYYLKLNDERFLSNEDSIKLNINSGRTVKKIIIGDHEDWERPRNFGLYIEKSENTKPTITELFSANGKTFDSALRAAQRTEYNLVQKDSVLLFDHSAHIKKGDIWRNQEVEVTVRLPLNSRLVIDERLSRYLHNYYDLWSCKPEGSGYETPSEWIMTSEGLKCKTDSLYFKKHKED